MNNIKLRNNDDINFFKITLKASGIAPSAVVINEKIDDITFRMIESFIFLLVSIDLRLIKTF